VKPAQKRAVVQFFRVGFLVSDRRACQVADVARSSHRYRSEARDQTPLRQRLRELAAVRVRYGYRRLHVLLRREGWPVNHKRVYRLYREEGLSIRTKHRKKRVSLPRIPLPPAAEPNERWSIDFLTDSLVDGRRFRAMTIVDNVSRVSPAIEVDVSITGERVVAMLNHLKHTVGLPRRIAVDNGPEFISKALDAWAYRNQVTLEFSRLGKPTDNAYVELFNGYFRAECLDQHWFETLAEAKEVIEAWRVDYNEERRHRSLQQRTPAAMLANYQPSEKAAD
jgi:putative transposase